MMPMPMQMIVPMTDLMSLKLTTLTSLRIQSMVKTIMPRIILMTAMTMATVVLGAKMVFISNPVFTFGFAFHLRSMQIQTDLQWIDVSCLLLSSTWRPDPVDTICIIN
jgi:hypothetical protein